MRKLPIIRPTPLTVAIATASAAVATAVRLSDAPTPRIAITAGNPRNRPNKRSIAAISATVAKGVSRAPAASTVNRLPNAATRFFGPNTRIAALIPRSGTASHAARTEPLFARRSRAARPSTVAGAARAASSAGFKAASSVAAVPSAAPCT